MGFERNWDNVNLLEQGFGVVILAAGASSRLGRPKQLLPYLGKTLVEHAARTALASGATEVIVVVGAHAQEVRAKLAGLPIRVVTNREWEEGMASSIRCGFAALGPEIRCAIVALCDQPRITPGLLRDLVARHVETSSPVVAASYDGVIGAPCAFSRELFPELLALTGDSGARELIRSSPEPVERVEFCGGNVDIDTTDDYQKLVPGGNQDPESKQERVTPDNRAPPMR